MICWKIRIFAYWTTPRSMKDRLAQVLWFAEKFVSLLIEQHRILTAEEIRDGCDLLKNSYLCLLNNTQKTLKSIGHAVVICWKIRIFAYWTTPRSVTNNKINRLWFAEKFVSLLIEQHLPSLIYIREASCDLLKNSYLCLLNNTHWRRCFCLGGVVICWKIRIFAYWTTPGTKLNVGNKKLWFAEKFVSLLIEQHLIVWK